MTPLEEIRALFEELMGWTGEDLVPVEFVLAAYVSTFLKGARERTWGDLLGPPSIGKTEILRVFDDRRGDVERRTVVRNDLTENAFTSAYRSEENPNDDRSLLYLLSYDREPRGPKVLILPELTTILELGKDRARKFFGEMRAAYDGQFSHQTGNLGALHYKLGFGVFTACTEKLDDYRRQNQALGERTVICRIGKDMTDYGDRLNMGLHTLDQNPQAKERLRAKLRDTVLSAIEGAIPLVSTEDFTVQQPASLRDRLAHLGTLATAIRTSPVSDRSYASSTEGPSRLIQELRTWGDAHAGFDGRTCWNEEDYRLMRRIAYDTMPPEYMRVLRLLWGRGAGDRLSKSFEQIRSEAVCDDSIHRQLKQWVICKVLKEDAGDYKLHPDIIDGLDKTGFMEGTV